MHQYHLQHIIRAVSFYLETWGYSNVIQWQISMYKHGQCYKVYLNMKLLPNIKMLTSMLYKKIALYQIKTINQTYTLYKASFIYRRAFTSNLTTFG